MLLAAAECVMCLAPPLMYLGLVSRLQAVN
jgi:hypothetical protein